VSGPFSLILFPHPEKGDPEKDPEKGPDTFSPSMAKRMGFPNFVGSCGMRNVTFGSMIMGMLSVFLNGCGQAFRPAPDTDVTSSPKYKFSSFAGTRWKTKVKVALVDCEQYTGRHANTIVPPVCFDPAHPNFTGLSPNMQMIRVLPVGTRLRIERLMKDNGNWGGLRVTGSMEDGDGVYLADRLFARNFYSQTLTRMSGPGTLTFWRRSRKRLHRRVGKMYRARVGMRNGT